MGKVKKNLFYQSIYQILAILLPLVTTPIVTRGLGADALGQYSYTYAIVSYFSVFAMLGVNNYGTREIAKTKVTNSKEELGRVFSEIYSLQMFLAIIAIVVYYSFVFLLNVKYKQLAIIQGIYLIGTLTDVAWFYWGIENFKTTVTRSIIVKLICALIIIFFVRKPDDLVLYTVVLIGSTAISNIILRFRIRKYVRYSFPPIKAIVKHLKPNLVLFIPVVAASFYVYIDKIMLGAISTTTQTGYYEVMDKIINVPNACIGAITSVMFPRISMLVASKKKSNQISNYFNLSMGGVVFFTIGCFFGMAAVADSFVPMFLGEEFRTATDIVIMGCAILIPRGIRGVVKSECLLPYEKDKEVIIAIVSGAACDFVVNLVLIPKYGAMGATTATLVCETVSCVIMIFFARKKFKFLKLILLNVPFIIFGFGMYLLIDFVNSVTSLGGWLGLIVYICIGGTFYCILSLLYLFFIKKKSKF